MYQSRRQLELCPKRQERHRQKEKSGSYSEERGYHEEKHKQHPVETTNCSCHVNDDETYRSNPSNGIAKAKSKGSSTSDEELRRDPWSGQSHNELSVTTDRLVEATNPKGKKALMMPLPGLGRTTSKPTHMPSFLPRGIRDSEHSLRQHPTRNSEGHILICAAPTGSSATANTVSMTLKTKRSSFAIKTTEVCYQSITTLARETCLQPQASAKIQRRHQKNKLYTKEKYPKVRREQYPVSGHSLKPSDPEYFPSANDERLPTFFRAKTTVATQKQGKGLQPLSFENGEILQFQLRLFSKPPGDQARYLFQLGKDLSVVGWVFAKDVELVYNVAW